MLFTEFLAVKRIFVELGESNYDSSKQLTGDIYGYLINEPSIDVCVCARANAPETRRIQAKIDFGNGEKKYLRASVSDFQMNSTRQWMEPKTNGR